MSTAAVEGRVRGLRRRSGGADSANSDVAVMEAELVLLREENARLRVLQAREASAERALESARALSAQATAVTSDEGLRALANAASLRESLLAVCGEVEGALAAVRERLTEESAAPASAPGSEPASSGVAPVPVSWRDAMRSSEDAHWTVGRLCSLVAAAEESLPSDRVEELHAYIEHLSQYATDGVLPAAFHELAEEIFSDLVDDPTATAVADRR